MQKKSTAILQIVDPDLAGRPLRQPLSQPTTPPSISGTSWRACPASATSTSSAPASIRCASGSIRTSCKARGLNAAGRHPGAPAAEPASHRRPGRHAADAARRQDFQYTSNVAGPPRRCRASSTNIIVKTGNNGEITRRARRRPRRARRADLQPGISRSTASRRPASASSSRPAPTRSRSSSAGQGQDGGAGAQAFRRASTIRHPVRHHDLRQRLDRRSLQDADRGRRSWC